METAQKLYVQLVMASGYKGVPGALTPSDLDMARKCAKQANELAVEFGLAMGLMHKAEDA